MIGKQVGIGQRQDRAARDQQVVARNEQGTQDRQIELREDERQDPREVDDEEDEHNCQEADVRNHRYRPVASTNARSKDPASRCNH